jgi:hypothetical protein
MANLGVEGYVRARTSSSGESGVAETFPGVEPQSVQTGYLTISLIIILFSCSFRIYI